MGNILRAFTIFLGILFFLLPTKSFAEATMYRCTCVETPNVAGMPQTSESSSVITDTECKGYCRIATPSENYSFLGPAPAITSQDITAEQKAEAKGLQGAQSVFKIFGVKSGFPDTTTAPPEVIVGKIIKSVLLLIGVIFGGLVIYAGYLWMIARGNEEMATRAKTILENAAIGIIIVAGAYAITNFIVDRVLSITYQ